MVIELLFSSTWFRLHLHNLELNESELNMMRHPVCTQCSLIHVVITRMNYVVKDTHSEQGLVVVIND